MGRRAEGWKLRADPDSGILYVRFSWEGARREFSTGETDRGRAAKRAAEIYGRAIAGQLQAGRFYAARVDLEDIAGDWLASIEGTTHTEATAKLYRLHMSAHLIPFFETLDRITSGSIGDYQRSRLGKVMRETVIKERNTLSVFLSWCREHKLVDRIEFPDIPRGALGHRATTRKTAPVDITPEQAAAFLAALPERSPGLRGSRSFAVRSRFVVAWETTLRPSTLDKIRCPDHYSIGAKTLVIADEIDKARFGREVPLTQRARDALNRAITDRRSKPGESFLIFGRHDARDYVAAAAKAANLPKGFSPYDLRHGRALELTEASSNLPGVAYMMGHRKLSTTDRYLRGTRRAADAVLAALGDSGGIVGAKPVVSRRRFDGRKVKSLRNRLVRRAGLEPARCLVASTSRQRVSSLREKPWGAPKQKAAENGLAWLDSGGVPQNDLSELLGLAKGPATLGFEWDWFDALEAEGA